MHRKIVKSNVFLDSHLLQLWIYCLARASHKDNDYPNGSKIIKLKPGQFRTGRRELAMDMRVNENTIYKRLLMLKKLGMVELKSDRKGTTVTVVNWGEYQDISGNGNNQSNNKRNNTSSSSSNSTSNNKRNTYKEIKKEEKEKNKDTDLPVTEETEEELFKKKAERMKEEKTNGYL